MAPKKTKEDLLKFAAKCTPSKMLPPGSPERYYQITESMKVLWGFRDSNANSWAAKLKDLFGLDDDLKPIAGVRPVWDTIPTDEPYGSLDAYVMAEFGTTTDELEAFLRAIKAPFTISNLIALRPKPGRPAKVSPSEVIELREQGLTQKEVAQKLKISQGRVAQIEKEAIRNDDIIIISNTEAPREQGTSREYAIARLKRDAPEYHQKVLDGELSAHAAMKEAGLKTARISVSIKDGDEPAVLAGKLYEKFDEDYLRSLVSCLGECFGWQS